MRKAGQALQPYVNTGEGCTKTPEKYPPKPQGGMSHGPKLLDSYVIHSSR